MSNGNVNIGDDLIGFQPSAAFGPTEDPRGMYSYPSPFKEVILTELAARIANAEWILEHVVRDDNVLSSILVSKEITVISNDKVAIWGDVTLGDWARDVSGQAIGGIDPSLTRIRGGVIQTEKIYNWDMDTWINLDAGKDGQDTEFISVSDYVKIHYNGEIFLGDAEGNYYSFDPETGIALYNISTNDESAGLSIGSVPTTTGYQIGPKGIRGYSGGDLVLVHALQNITEGDWSGLTAGDFGVGDKSANHFVFFDFSAGKMYFRGEINADDIVAGTITGRTLQTASSGDRFVVSAATGHAQFISTAEVVADIGWLTEGGLDYIARFGKVSAAYNRIGVGAFSYSSRGLHGGSYSGSGVYGSSFNSYGVEAVSQNGYGLYASGIYCDGSYKMHVGSETYTFTLHRYDELHAEWIEEEAYITRA